MNLNFYEILRQPYFVLYKRGHNVFIMIMEHHSTDAARVCTTSKHLISQLSIKVQSQSLTNYGLSGFLIIFEPSWLKLTCEQLMACTLKTTSRPTRLIFFTDILFVIKIKMRHTQ